MKTDEQVYAAAAGLGVVAGMRSMAAPALVTNIARKGKLAVPGSKLSFLNGKGALTTTLLLAAGELVADKLPKTPNRTDMGPLIARTVSGGLSGAVLCVAKKRSVWLGVMYGAMGALGAAFAAYYLRKTVTESLGLPDSVVGLAEDAVVASMGLLVVSQMREEAA